LWKKADIPETENPAIIKEEAKTWFLKAIPYLKKAFEINARSLETVRALKQTFYLLGNEQEYQFYDEIEAELLNSG